MSRLSGKLALVTGAGGGIGTSVCAQFLAEGASVAAFGRDTRATTAALGEDAIRSGRGIVIQGDVGQDADVAAAVAETVSRFGSLNVLVNIAGGASDKDGTVVDASEDEFWRVIRTDLFGTFLLGKYGIPELARAGGGSVINMTSMTAILGVPNRACYSAAKGGVAAMTRSMAVAHAVDKIRVNAVAPGITLTSRIEAMFAENQTLRDQLGEHLMGAVNPDDVAAMVVYLASDESKVVTGQVLQVDSGITIH